MLCLLPLQWDNFLEHEVTNIANVMCFDESVLIVERQIAAGGLSNYTTYVYHCGDSAHVCYSVHCCAF